MPAVGTATRSGQHGSISLVDGKGRD
jgi:hypothetical protein